jgi:hypothetical protein
MSTPALLAASLALSAVGAVSSGIAAKRAADFNAAIALQQAQRERDIANRNADIFRRQQNALSASERARRAGAGVLQSTGTPLLVADAFLDETLIGEATIRAGGETRATRLEAEAALARFRGSNARTAGFISAGSTLLTAGAFAVRNPLPVTTGFPTDAGLGRLFRTSALG